MTSIRAETVIKLDRSVQAEAAVAHIAPGTEGIYIVGKPLAVRTTFGKARENRWFAYSDEEIFVARGGGCALVNFEIGVDWLIAPR